MKDCTLEKPPFCNLNQLECAVIKMQLPLIFVGEVYLHWVPDVRMHFKIQCPAAAKNKCKTNHSLSPL